MVRRIVQVEHYDVGYEVSRNSTGWTVWESRGGDNDREVAWFPAPEEDGMDALIQRATDAIEMASRVLVAGARVRVGDALGYIIAVNQEALVEFDGGEYSWFPILRVRAA